MRLHLVPYKKFSAGAKELAKALSERLGYKVFRGPLKPKKVNIVWGQPNAPGANKLTTFELFKQHNVSSPIWSTSKNDATKWITKGIPVIARKLLNASEGRGAVYTESVADLPDAPLYVQYIPKKKEFRVHVWDNEVVFVQEKRRRQGSNADAKIRNHGDWVFCFNNIAEPADLRAVALAAAAAVGHSGAVDIIYNERKNKCYALEINSAPGLCPTSAKKYAEHFVRKYA